MNLLAGASDFLHLSGRRSMLLHLALIASGIAFTVASAVILHDDKPAALEPASMTTTVALLGSMMLILLARHRWPLTVLVASTVLLLTVRRLDVPEFQVSGICWLVALYSAGRFGSGTARQVVRAAAITSTVVLLVVDVVEVWNDLDLFGYTKRTFVLSAGSNIGWNLLVFIGAWVAGDAGRNRAQRDRELAVRNLELEASREENAQRAVMDERVRIARELHDVVAHHVSVMGLQAGAARRALASDPTKAEAPLRNIEASSRDAVGELQRLLGFLRRADEIDTNSVDPESLAPQPGLGRLDALRRNLAEAGLALQIQTTGTERQLPPSVDLNAYRILQEALTNCLRYAGVHQAEVEIQYAPDHLRLAVRDRGRGVATVPDPANRGGAGLKGMRERAALLGGTVDFGPRSGGGYEVEAVLPYDARAAAAPAAVAT